MKNIFWVLGAVILLVIISKGITENDLIPEDAIRIRVIANSNSDVDQSLKQMVRKDVEQYMYQKLENIDNVQEADYIIRKNISEVQKIVSTYTDSYKVNYGLNYFPAKEYKSISYPAGEYKSLVITLGTGLGDNWWCVLFPPLCLMEAEENSDVEYHSYVVDTINKYLK